MPRVYFKPLGVHVDVKPNTTVYEAARRVGVDVGGICGGRGVCGKCRVRIVRGKVSEPTSIERKFITDDMLARGFRLACQVRILDDTEVEVYYKRTLITAILGYEPKVELKPAVLMFKVKPEPVTLNSTHASTFESILKPLNITCRVYNVEILRRLSDKLPESVYILVHYDHKLDSYDIIDVLEYSIKPLGLAIDVGTTKVAIYIVDLKSGDLLVAESFENPQVIYGEDVISRIAYASEHDVFELQKVLIEELNKFIDELCRSRGLNPKHIVDVVAVGNSVMHHLLLGINPKKLGISPYELIVREPLTLEASSLGLNVHPRAKIYLPPPVRGFIGSDSLVGIAVLGLDKKSGTYMFIDIGTNTEVYLVRNGIIYATSTASGPAFEGGHIRCGMKALEGAIDHVVIDPETLEAKISTIGYKKPLGICGSGIIDAIAEMLKCKIIDYTGKFIVKDHPRIKVIECEGPSYILVYKHESETEDDIVITQRDVREIQKAKAAIQTAYKILARKLGVKRDDIDEVYIAGSFGFYLNPENAITIGLIPEVEPDRVKIVGNTAGSGARILLKNTKWRSKVEMLAKEINYVELAVEKDFHRVYIDSLYLPSKDINEYPRTFRKLGITR